MSRRALLLFLSVGVIWGTPYFFIALALEHFQTVSIVFLRVLLGTLVLLPIAFRKGMLRRTLEAWPSVLAFAVLEMVGPWWLITEAEREITSSLAGLLITTVPFIAAFCVGLLGDKSAWHPVTVLGLVVGFSGVVSLVGLDVFSGLVGLSPVLMVVAAAVGYAVAPIVANRMPSDVPTLGVIAVSLTIVTIIYAPFAAFTLPVDIAAIPSLEAWGSVLFLGFVCSALAFVLFFALIREIGPARASLLTYVNLAVALLLGVVFLAEPLTLGMLVGLPLVAIGSYLASQRREAYVRKSRRGHNHADQASEVPENL
ncbi:MAG: EamA family transporter [Actinobacteria bacterium]|jgi:drug/metabolite transporter (DMT)-like permease|nr:EamA family transporter [Actinomycetota bacterium]